MTYGSVKEEWPRDSRKSNGRELDITEELEKQYRAEKRRKQPGILTATIEKGSCLCKHKGNLDRLGISESNSRLNKKR